MKFKSVFCLFLSVLLITVFCPFSVLAAAGDHPDIMRGDADLDGDIQITDVTAIQRTLAQLPTASFDERAAILIPDELDITDATILQRYLNDMPYPEECDIGSTALFWDDDRYITAVEVYQSYLDDHVEEKDFSGVVYITRYGRVLAQSATGTADYDTDAPITIDTLFPIGSVSKQFCAAAILLLQEQGKLSVDDTLDKYFPEYIIGKDITVKDLLTMRSGIDPESSYKFQFDDNIPDDADPNDLVITYYATAQENKNTMKTAIFRQELIDEPGTKFIYCNDNYFLLSCIVEQVSGTDYQSFVRENIFQPLGMTHSGFYDDPADAAVIAQQGDYEMVCFGDIKGSTAGAGDIVSNAADMDKWMTSLRTHSLLTEESVDEMSTNYSSRETYYGYGICPGSDGTLFHNGSVDTYYAYDFTDPGCGYNFFAVTNDGVPFAGFINTKRLTIDAFSRTLINYTWE